MTTPDDLDLRADPPEGGHASATKPLRRPRRRWLSALALLGALVLLLLGLLAGGTRWLLATESGTAWLLARLPMVQVKGYQGTLLGDQWRADSLRVEWAGGQQWLLIEGLAADGLRWAWRPNPHAWVALQADKLVARKFTLHTGPPSGEPFQLPARIAPPLQLALAQLQVDVAVIDGMEPIGPLLASKLQLDARPGAEHSVEALQFSGFGVQVAGALRIGNSAPMPLSAQATVQPSMQGNVPANVQTAPGAGPARWTAQLRATGSVEALQLSGSLRGLAQARTPGPVVDLRAAVRPLQAWPLTSLDLQTQALDLAALTPKAPSTRLSGHAQLSGGRDGAPLQASVDLVNTQPGRWNEQRLPLHKLTLEVKGQRTQPDRVEMTQFELVLADAMRGAGRWSGKALWQGSTLTLDTLLNNVTPQRLDGRAAAMTLSGPVSATLRGLPSPATLAQPASAASAAASAPAGATSAAAPAAKTAATPAGPSLDWNIKLQGRFDAAPQPVQLQLEGSADSERVDLARARAQAGDAVLQLSARLQRSGPVRDGARRPWQLQSNGSVTSFDPLPWWPGDADADAAWRRGPHRLSGDWQFDLRLPADAARLRGFDLVQRLAGNGKLQVHDSMLAGVPLTADVVLGYAPAAAPTPGSLRAQLSLGGNQFVIDGRGDPAGSGDSDRWHAEIKADALQSLAPLLRLRSALAEWAPRQGALNASVQAEGRWPDLRTEGKAQLSKLAAGKLELARADASWRFDSSGTQPMLLQAELAGMVYDTQRAERLRAELRGTLADHRIEVSGALPLGPPPAAVQVLGLQAQNGTRAQLLAQGAWTADGAGGGRWQTRIERLLVGAWDGSSSDTPLTVAWAEARDLRAEVQVDAQGRPTLLQAEPGRLRLAQTTALRWDAIHIDLRGPLPMIALRADIEAFALAPLLARLQPSMGWAGDLKVGARLDIRAAERMDADVVIERVEGDLHMSSGEGTQLLGLTDMRLAVSAHDGQWNFAPIFRGRSLGDITGQIKVQTTPEQRWPPAAAPIEGSVQARVADIGIWGAWVPAGWRLTGELRTSAAVSGSFGAPQYTGELGGNKLGVRNLLEGVNVSDGQVLVRLQGDTAQIERFTLKGGDGTLTVSGGATLGAKPQARLQLKAERFRVLGRVDRQIIASGSAEALLQADSARIDGKFVVDEGLLDASRSNAPSLDDDVSLREAGQPYLERSADPAAAKPRFNLALGVDVDLGDKLRVRGYGLDSALRGQLRATTPGGRLQVHGTINTEGGTFAAYGQKLLIERGVLAFSGPLDNPRLDVLALRPNIDYRVGAQITGNLLTYRLRLYSEPEMSDNDKLSWLVLGRAPDGLGRSDTALLQRAAVALFSGEGEAPTDALMKTLGIDDVSLRQSEGDVRETVISIGKQLSRRWYLGYERGVNSTTGTWQLIYRIAQRLTVRLQSGLENAVDVIWTWRVQETPDDAGMRKSTVVPR